jgi:hypothetical protein
MLVTAYDSPHIAEVIPGLRAAVAATRHEELPERARNVMAFLGSMQSPFDVIELN